MKILFGQSSAQAKAVAYFILDNVRKLARAKFFYCSLDAASGKVSRLLPVICKCFKCHLNSNAFNNHNHSLKKKQKNNYYDLLLMTHVQFRERRPWSGTFRLQNEKMSKSSTQHEDSDWEKGRSQITHTCRHTALKLRNGIIIYRKAVVLTSMNAEEKFKKKKKLVLQPLSFSPSSFPLCWFRDSNTFSEYCSCLDVWGIQQGSLRCELLPHPCVWTC